MAKEWRFFAGEKSFAEKERLPGFYYPWKSCASWVLAIWRRHPDLNWGVEDLQSSCAGF